jgi:hypothetical protein
MPISWNEIRQNAIHFSREWAGARSESAEKQTLPRSHAPAWERNSRTL